MLAVRTLARHAYIEEHLHSGQLIPCSQTLDLAVKASLFSHNVSNKESYVCVWFAYPDELLHSGRLLPCLQTLNLPVKASLFSRNVSNEEKKFFNLSTMRQSRWVNSLFLRSWGQCYKTFLSVIYEFS
jgi:hypothetical protein